MALSLGFMYLATHLARFWIKERRTSCLKIGGELSGANCPGGELSDIRSVTAHCCVILPGITKLKSCIRSTYFQLWNKLKLPIFYKTSSHKLKAFVIVWNRNVTFILTIKPILGFHQSCDQN